MRIVHAQEIFSSLRRPRQLRSAGADLSSLTHLLQQGSSAYCAHMIRLSFALRSDELPVDRSVALGGSISTLQRLARAAVTASARCFRGGAWLRLAHWRQGGLGVRVSSCDPSIRAVCTGSCRSSSQHKLSF